MSLSSRAERARSASPQSVRPKNPFRSDIQAIRALAVLLVVANHLTQWPSGGYIGVDVFFVVSGFVITAGLLREQRTTGWISMSSFYARRLRRIMPVALAVAGVSVIMGFSLWLTPRALQTALDGISAIFWVSNWHFAALGTDYLAASGPVSPFQHYWSLSVEEQFYLVMPWAVVFLGLVATRLRRVSTRSVIIVGFGLLAIVSFAWSVFLTSYNPAVSYFDTIGRSWEFLAGALMAAVGSSKARRSRIAAGTLRFIGLVMIVGSAILLTAKAEFPGPGALLPVLGTALMIAAGPEAAPIKRSLLSNPVLQYFGNISYSLYLWHFPVIIYLHVLIPGNGPLYVIVAILVMLGLSHGSWKYVEQPARHSGWLRSWEIVPPVRSKKWKSKQLLGGVAVTLVVAVLAASQIAGPNWMRSATAIGTSPSTAMDQCRNSTGTATPRFCYYGDQKAGKTTLVLGDSVAVSWIPTVASAAPDERVLGVGYASCSPFDLVTLPRNMTSTFVAECNDAKERMYEIAAAEVPATIVLSSDLGGYLRQGDGATGQTAARNWESSVQRTAIHYKDLGASVIILSSPPLGEDISDCSNRLTEYDRCSTSMTAEWKMKAGAEAKAAQNAGVTFVDVRDWFCETDENCPAVVSGIVARSDATHITEQMAVTLGHRLAEALRLQ